MGPQGEIPAAASILGTIGTVLWCVQIVPQIWYNWHRKSTDGLPGTMLFLWAAAAIPFGVYNIVQNFNIPLQVQPQVFCALALICWGQVLVYSHGFRIWTTTLIAFATGIVFAAVETILILTLRRPYSKGISWPITMIGIIAAILLALGLLPPYLELWKRKGRVVGINFVFLTMDWFGAFFSLMALVAQQHFDYLGGILYIVCMLIELGIYLSQTIWLYRTRKVRRVAKLAGKSFDEYIDEHDCSSTDTHNDTLDLMGSEVNHTRKQSANGNGTDSTHAEHASEKV